MIQSQKKYRKTDVQTALHINSPLFRKSVYAPQHNDLVFEKNLMRANAVDFKNCNVGVVDFVKPELVPVLVVINCAEGTSSGAGASMTAACAV